MTLEDDLETMRLFNDKVNVLRRSEFAREMFTKKTGVTFGFRKTGETTGIARAEVRGPGEDAINAMVLTVRLVMQDNDRISLHHMARLMERLLDQGERVTRFLDQRTILNTFLAADTEPVLTFNGMNLKNGQIFRNVIYGELAHLDEEKKKEMTRIRSPLFMTQIVDNEFNYIASQVIAILFSLQVQNQHVYRGLTGEELPISWPNENPEPAAEGGKGL